MLPQLSKLLQEKVDLKVMLSIMIYSDLLKAPGVTAYLCLKEVEK